MKLNGTPQCLTLYTRSRIKRCRYNRVRLYLDPDPLEYQAGAVSWTAAFPNEDHVSTTTLFPTQTHWNAPHAPSVPIWCPETEWNQHHAVTAMSSFQSDASTRHLSRPVFHTHARTHARTGFIISGGVAMTHVVGLYTLVSGGFMGTTLCQHLRLFMCYKQHQFVYCSTGTPQLK